MKSSSSFSTGKKYRLRQRGKKIYRINYVDFGSIFRCEFPSIFYDIVLRIRQEKVPLPFGEIKVNQALVSQFYWAFLCTVKILFSIFRIEFRYSKIETFYAYPMSAQYILQSYSSLLNYILYLLLFVLCTLSIQNPHMVKRVKLN